LGQRGSLGKCSLNASSVWSRKAIRSTKNNTLSAQPARINASTKAMQVLVLPVPVAITNKNLRFRFSTASITARIEAI